MNHQCLNCGNKDFLHVRPYRTNTKEGKQVFAGAILHECRDCGLVQSVPGPAPSTLQAYYEKDYRTRGYGGSDVADVEQFPNDNLYYCNRGRSITERLKPFLSRSNLRILDIGAGYGHILYFLGQAFPQSERFAIEFSEACIRHLKSQNIQVLTHSVEDVLSEMTQRFDLVTISHVLEHLLDPKAILRLIHTSLAKDGLLYVEVPNIPPESLLRYPDHRWAPRFDEPHITFFSEPTLRKLLESTGFELQFSSTAGPQYKYISALRFRMPPFRETLEASIPKPLFRFLRRRKFTQAVRVQNKEESFFQYGGFRLWIRGIWKKKERT